MKTKLTKVTENNITDLGTGEVVTSQQSQTFYLPKEPSYIKFYIEDIGNIHGLSKGESDVLFALEPISIGVIIDN